jgi:hypothetical protein
MLDAGREDPRMRVGVAVAAMTLASGHLLGQVYTGEVKSGSLATHLNQPDTPHGTVVVGVALSEGLVLAADSRIVTTGNAGFYRVISDYTSKLFDIGNVGVAWYGQAFLQGRSLGGWLSDFKAKKPTGDVDHMADAISAYLATPYDSQFPATIQAPSPSPVPATADTRPIMGLLIAGYDTNGIGKLMRIEFPNQRKPNEAFTTRRTGAMWSGETDVISRLILGYDNRIRNTVPFLTMRQELSGVADAQLHALQYNIPFDALMMQDGIDFASSLVRVTVEMQRFSHGTIGDASDIPGVGGSVDILAITPFDIQWISRKHLDYH